MSETDVFAEDQRSRSDSHCAHHDIIAIINDPNTTIVAAVGTGELTRAQLASFVESTDPEAETVDPALIRVIEIVSTLLADRQSYGKFEAKAALQDGDEAD